MSSKHNLLSCPCCGGQAQICNAIRTYFDFYIVKCDECGIRTKDCNTPDDAVEKWNKRKDKKAMKEITRITTVEITQIVEVEDEATIKSKEKHKADIEKYFAAHPGFDNANVTNVQDFIMDK